MRFVKAVFNLTLLTLCASAYAAEMPTPNKKPERETPSIIVYKQPDKLIDPTPVKRSHNAKPLNNRDIALYKEVYRLQNAKEWKKADEIIQKIDNGALIGHVLAHRYVQPNYGPTDLMIERWLDLYNDHPQAEMFAQKAGMIGIAYRNRVTGTLNELRYFTRGSKYISANYNSGQRYELRLVKQKIEDYLEKGYATAALDFFNQHRANRYIDPIDKSQILAEIASVYLYLGHNKKARRTALTATKLSTETPIAPWIMGLTAWINKDYKDAAKNFTMAANATYASPWMTSAAAYWGARASMRARDYKPVSGLLTKAVQNQRTFYGLIATKALGYGFDFNWTMPELTPKLQDTLLQYPAGARAYAMAQVGQLRLAEAELFSLPVKDDPHLAEAAIALANHYNLAGFAMRFSSAVENPAGGYYDAGLFPVSSWTTGNDRTKSEIALINAFIRQESRFDISARNATGATGLMQLMPETAAYIARDDIYAAPEGRELLFNPSNNIDIGSAYLNHLLDLKAVDRDLFSLAIAYNAGPGKLRRWQKKLKVEDPLLFIELIPSSETRAFVERVATNYWIYKMRTGQEATTLNAVASGDWPKIEP